MTTAERIKWIDFIRAFAILTVLICHSTEAIYPIEPEGLTAYSFPNQFLALLLFSIGRIGVPLFLFMSGYLLMDRRYDENACIRFWKTKWLGLLIATELWIIIYDVFLAGIGREDFPLQDYLPTCYFLGT